MGDGDVLLGDQVDGFWNAGNAVNLWEEGSMSPWRHQMALETKPAAQIYNPMPKS